MKTLFNFYAEDEAVSLHGFILQLEGVISMVENNPTTGYYASFDGVDYKSFDELIVLHKKLKKAYRIFTQRLKDILNEDNTNEEDLRLYLNSITRLPLTQKGVVDLFKQFITFGSKSKISIELARQSSVKYYEGIKIAGVGELLITNKLIE